MTVSEDCGERSVVEQDMADHLRRFAEGEAPRSDVHTYWLDALTERCLARSAHDGLDLPRASDLLARDVGPALNASRILAEVRPPRVPAPVGRVKAKGWGSSDIAWRQPPGPWEAPAQ